MQKSDPTQGPLPDTNYTNLTQSQPEPNQTALRAEGNVSGLTIPSKNLITHKPEQAETQLIHKQNMTHLIKPKPHNL